MNTSSINFNDPLKSLSFIFCLTASVLFPLNAEQSDHILTISDKKIHYKGEPVKLIGLRCSNALISDEATADLIAHLDQYKSYGLNTISVFIMGSRFGDVKGYLPDGTLNPVYRNRLQKVLESARMKNMILIVGCLYWGTSKANEELESWKQSDAETAIANTAAWLRKEEFSHVILDPDNEGMAVRAKGWSVESLIAAAKSSYPKLLVANNTRQDPPNEDLNLHFGNKESDKPYIDSESTPDEVAPDGYWGRYSKETHKTDSSFYNYSRIGRYTSEMKENQKNKTLNEVHRYNGIILASTWIQCGAAEGINGPFSDIGGYSNLGSVETTRAAWNKNIDDLHPDAGILWWLEFVRDTYGPWEP